MARLRRRTSPAPGPPVRTACGLSSSRLALFALTLCVVASSHGVAAAFGAVRKRGEDVSLVEWSHGTNSRWKLEQALSGRAAPYVEADVSQADGMAVMAHPPVRSWDLSLREFLRIVCGSPRNVTLKLDFKASEVLESAFLDMESAPLENLRDLWLNADIVEGPGGSPDVDAQHFLQLCTSRFPQATLSLGWTTRPMTSYTWAHVEAMARLLVCGPYRVPHVTFPVRASMLAASTTQLLWLLDVIPGSTLTVWSSPRDPWSTKTLVKLRSLLPLSAVYYDLPSDQKQDFDRAKAAVASSEQHNQHVDDGPLPEWSLGVGYSCQHRALAGKRAVVLAGPGAWLLLPKKWHLVEAKVDLTRIGSLSLGWGPDTDKVQINGGCFYVTLTNGPNITVQVWASPCLPTTSSFDEADHDKKSDKLRSGKPLVTRKWPSSSSPSPQTSSQTAMAAAPPNSLLLESPGPAVVYDVRISSSATASCATSLTTLLLLCLVTALAVFLLG
ncbi:uncharacterized protein LOC142575887 [Dermacentor variabilis]|uniref:uncharacterized protein LOC142575887 n=1 Tax=Dermacentor variabilis TaxID=34621 RepID=UPI003F5B22E1